MRRLLGALGKPSLPFARAWKVSRARSKWLTLLANLSNFQTTMPLEAHTKRVADVGQRDRAIPRFGLSC